MKGDDPEVSAFWRDFARPYHTKEPTLLFQSWGFFVTFLESLWSLLPVYQAENSLFLLSEKFCLVLRSDCLLEPVASVPA